ncbi:MAG: aldo/keto reductase [Geminicoccaceae bacterium]|nr:aldo/keto reductase [Geminicoccaceae bacterium]
MEYTTLGRTGLRVGVAGLGCGGSSRLGMGHGRTAEEAAGIVRAAFDLGVNLFDTAEAYRTEEAVGLAGLPRDEIVLSTKSRIVVDQRLVGPDELLAAVDGSLKRLRTDHVDVFHLHAVPPEHYEHALELRGTLERAKAAGKIRHVGITETGPADPGHRMLERATLDPGWEVTMLAFHMLNQNAKSPVLENTRRLGIGTFVMFAVRAIFSRPERLASALSELADAGSIDSADPAQLDFLIHQGGAASLIDAAYRYVRHAQGTDVILFGTGDRDHLAANIRSITAPPLPAADVQRLEALYGHLVGVGLDRPEGRDRS